MAATKRAAWCCVAVGWLLASPSRAQASEITLSLHDGNSDVDICVGGCAADPFGVFNWSVDGTNYISQEWFFYRVDGDGVQYTAGPGSIDSLGGLGVSNYVVNGTTATVTYGNSYVSAVVTYALTGGSGGSNTSKLQEDVTLTNNSRYYTFLNLFQYSDFDMCGPGSNDDVNIAGGVATQTATGGCGPVAVMSQVIANTPPQHVEAGLSGTIPSHILGGSDLNDNSSATNANVASGFQWNHYANYSGSPFGDSASFSITKLIAPAVPEPASMLLLGTGLIAIAQTARRRLGKRA